MSHQAAVSDGADGHDVKIASRASTRTATAAAVRTAGTGAAPHGERLRREIDEQPVEVAVGPRAQRGVQTLLELVRLEPTLDRGLAQALCDRVAVGVRRPERGATGHQLP